MRKTKKVLFSFMVACSFTLSACNNTNISSQNDIPSEKQKVAISTEGLEWDRTFSQEKMYDEENFLIDGNAFMAEYAYSLLELPDIKDHATTLNYIYDSTDQINITRDGENSNLAISFKGNENLNENIKKVSIKINQNKLAEPKSKETIVNIVSLLPYTLENKSVEFDECVDFVASQLGFSSEKDSLIDTSKLPIKSKFKGVNYIVDSSLDNIYVTASIGETTLNPLPLSEDDFFIPEKYWGDDEFLASNNGNIIGAICSNGSTIGSHYSFFDPQVDPSKEDIIETARGIKLGDSRDKVKNLYGPGVGGPVDFANDWNLLGLDDYLYGVMSAQCMTYLEYNYQNAWYISFYFDADDNVSWIFHSKRV